MDASGVVLDTDVLVSDLRGKTSMLRDLEGKGPVTTVINAFELFHGAYKSKESSTNLSATRGLLESLRVVGLSVKAAERAGEVLADGQKSGHTIEIRDLLIGCIAREEGLSLLTYNTKHFRKIPGLTVVNAAQYADR
ncbi:MAG: type II toxin-antitoxin system VapC family toxin [Nitrososphaerota archaeon]|nr:type II toxin-antitoxin system VapC family toxin [Nitrososphaerota archaeon]